jgi:hypothetical protein
MNIKFYEPRLRESSDKPIIYLTKNFISFNEKTMEIYFKNNTPPKEYVKIGLDKEKNMLVLMPVNKGEFGLKIMHTINSKKYYITASNIYIKFDLKIKDNTFYNFNWDENLKAIIIDLNK